MLTFRLLVVDHPLTSSVKGLARHACTCSRPSKTKLLTHMRQKPHKMLARFPPRKPRPMIEPDATVQKQRCNLAMRVSKCVYV